MKTPKHSLRKIVNFLNNPDEDGGFWLPSIQRPFVWNEEQTCRLFDSILRQYPISTLLVWKTTAQIKCRKFIDNFYPKHREHLKDFFVPENTKRKCLVLDGQQRLQSLYIGLKGSYEGRELFIDILSGEVAAPDDVKYHFRFLDPATASFPWLKFKDLVFSTENVHAATRNVLKAIRQDLSESDKNRIGEHIAIIFQTFRDDDGISYQELDSIENPRLYTEDDVVEVFIRANSGGTKLGKSDLLFALLANSWEEATDEMEALLDTLNRQGFLFERDFILKTCLALLDQGARYEVTKFRAHGVRESIEARWDDIAAAITDVLDYIKGKTFVKCDKALPSYNVLIPLIYFRYHQSAKWASAIDLDNYLLRSSLTGAFSGTPDQLIDDIIKTIRSEGEFNVEDIFNVVRSKGRSLELTEDRFWSLGYGSDQVHLLFNLWYRDFNYTPAYDKNLPQVDHIFPQSLLRRIKKPNPDTGRMNLMRYKDADRNQLANCMLLTQKENGAGGKSDTPPHQWFVGGRADKAYLEKHLIPNDPALWQVDRFEDFIEARKKLIVEKFASLLVPASSTVPPPATKPSTPRNSRTKSIDALIDAKKLTEGEVVHLSYRGRNFTGQAVRGGIKLDEGIFAPSEAAVRCYARAGSERPTENGWRVWKTSKGSTLNDLLATLDER